MQEYTIKDRNTDEILIRGTEKECASYIGCSGRYLRDLAKQMYTHKAETKYSRYKVERKDSAGAKNGGARVKDIVCSDCGILMRNVCASRRRCPECSRKHAREQNRRHMRDVRNSHPAIPGMVNDGNTECDGCIYFFGDYSLSRCCNYIFIKGEPRPCKPGKGCTVKEERNEIGG